MKSSMAVYTLLLLAAAFPVAAQDINPECLKSFNVKDVGIVVENATLSCIKLEKYRADIFNSYESYVQKAKEVQNDSLRNYLIKSIDDMQSKLESASRTDYSQLSSSIKSIIGNFTATMALSACITTGVETVGWSCVAATLLWVNNKYSLIDSVISMQEKQTQLNEMKQKLIDAKNVFEKTKDFKNEISKTSSKFNQLCNLVREKCL